MRKVQLEFRVRDTDASDFISAKVDDVESDYYDLRKPERGNRERAEKLLVAAVLDAFKAAEVGIGDRVTIEFTVQSLNPKQPLIGYADGILTFVTVNQD